MKVFTRSSEKPIVKPSILVLGLFHLVSIAAFGQANVIHVSMTLRMKSTDPIAPRDYYIDVGSRDGVKPGDVLTVSRLVAVPNSMWQGPMRAMQVPIAEVQVTYAGDSSSITRVIRRPAAQLMAQLEYSQIMVGDEVGFKTGLPSSTPSF